MKMQFSKLRQRPGVVQQPSRGRSIGSQPFFRQSNPLVRPPLVSAQMGPTYGHTYNANGIEWSLDNDASNAAVLVASEAYAITLAIEGLLGVVFTVATLTDEAVDAGELESPKSDNDPPAKYTGKTTILCISMVDSMWLIILDALSDFNKSPGPKRSDPLVDQRDSVVLTPKNVQALRTLFNIAHPLHNVLGPSSVLVLETLAALDRAIHSPHATTQVSIPVPKLTRELSNQYSDFNILSSLNSQLFERSALMHISAIKSLLSALGQLSQQCIMGSSASIGQASSQEIGSISFS